MTQPPQARAPAVVAKGLTKRYGSTLAVDDLDLTVRRGEIFGLLGPNGAGKTTTILMLLGLSEPTSGTAAVVGLDPTREPLAVKRLVGYLPDDVGFYDNLTGRENLKYTARLNRLDTDSANQRIKRVIHEVDLVDSADRPVRGYSRGMRQRLGIADALLKEPSVLILDEPTVNIDPEGVEHILQLAQRLRDDHGVTIVLSSHLLGQVQQICDRIGIFIGGRLAALGTIEELAVSGSVEIEVATADPTVDLDALLVDIAGVQAIDRSNEFWVVTASHDCRDAIAMALVNTGHGVRHLTARRADLAAIYHRYSKPDVSTDDGRP